MEVICSICRCSISRSPPEGSTDLADICPEMKTPDPPAGRRNIISDDKDDPDVVSTACGHVFHNACLTQWYLMIGNRRCPLCNFVTPVHGMIRIFPTMDKSGESVENFSDCAPLPSSARDSLAAGDGGDSSEAHNPEGSSTSTNRANRAEEQNRQGPSEQQPTVIPFQKTETTVNGIRTMVYHFRQLPPETATTSEMVNELLGANMWCNQPQQHQTRTRATCTSWRRETVADRIIRSSRQCSTCSNYSRIQALMTSDLQDLRNLIAEQDAKIQDLEAKLVNAGVDNEGFNSTSEEVASENSSIITANKS